MTIRADGTPATSVVNVGVLPHPDHRRDVVAFVGRGRTRKLENLRTRRHLTLVVRAGWEWVAAEGHAELRGPDDTDPEQLRLLLRDIFLAAGGSHENFAEYDRVMREDARTAVLLEPTRVYTNPPQARHVDRT